MPKGIISSLDNVYNFSVDIISFYNVYTAQIKDAKHEPQHPQVTY